jgi:TolB protein
MKPRFRPFPPAAIAFILLSSSILHAQDWVHTGTNLGQDRIRLATAEFKPLSAEPQTPSLKAIFDATLYGDLSAAGIFDMVSRSLAPQANPGSPQEISLQQWSQAPANAAMVAFGSLSASGGRLTVLGWLFDARNTVSPQILGKQYTDVASQDAARTLAHRFADEIILRLGGGINGIAETKIYFMSTRTGSKEIWSMDYDGQNQHQVTHLGSISLSPRISPDNSRIAFASLGREGWAVRMYSLDLDRPVAFPAGVAGGSNQSPAWSADGAVGRRRSHRLFFIALRRLRNLARRCEWRKSPPPHRFQRPERRAHL